MQPSSSSSSLKSKVELSFSCRELKNYDAFSKSDPQIYVYNQAIGQREWILAGRTEKVPNDLNPTFLSTVVVDYHFENVQHLKFIVVDVDDGHSFDPNDQDYIGELSTQLGSIISRPGLTLTKDLLDKKGKVSGYLTVKALEIKSSGQSLKIRITGKHFDKKKRFFGKADPFYNIFKLSQSNEWSRVWVSEMNVKDTLNPKFKELIIPFDQLNEEDNYCLYFGARDL
eukprot:gene8013-9414_t